MKGAKLVSDIINQKKPQRVLDLGAQRGYFSILAASYGAEVDAVDHLGINNCSFPEYLKGHPNINFHQCDIKEFKINKSYDLVIAKHIIINMDKSRVLNELLPNIYDNLNRGGLTFLTYHLPHSYMFKSDDYISKYEINDFKKTGKNFILKDFGQYENPVKDTKNETYHIGYIVLQK